MPSDLTDLFTPTRIGRLDLPNRIFMPAYTTGYDTDRYAAYLARRARGGVALTVTGAMPVHPSSVASLTIPRAYPRESIAGFARIADAVHRNGGRLFGQLFHIGPQDAGTVDLDLPHVTFGPTPVSGPLVDRIPKAMDEDDIATIVAAFGQCAVNLREAGFDGVEIHGAHGYLVHAFLSPTTNHRGDGYGGSAANRARFALEIAAEVRRRCGVDFPMILRLSLDELIGEVGMTPQRSIDLVTALHEPRLFDAFDISGTNYQSLSSMASPATSGREALFLDSAAAVRSVVGHDVPVMLAGGIPTVELAAEVLAGGSADLVGLARALIADPDVVLKARSGQAARIRRCVRANQGCYRRLQQRTLITCTVNPAAGREATVEPASATAAPRRLVVVGAGPAGLQVAHTAAARGHRVILLERSRHVGGQLRLAARLPYRNGWAGLLDQLRDEVDRHGVELRPGTAATAGLVSSLGPDVVVLATGAHWDRSGFSSLAPSADPVAIDPRARVFDPVDAMTRAAEIGKNVVVVDDSGAYPALGLAEHLVGSGHAVRFVTLRPMVGDRSVLTNDRPFVLGRLTAAKVRFHSSTRLDRIDAGSVTLTDTLHGVTETIATDSVVLHLARRSDDSLFHELVTAGHEVVRIGDCLAPREVDDALYEGWRLGLDI